MGKKKVNTSFVNYISFKIKPLPLTLNTANKTQNKIIQSRGSQFAARNVPNPTHNVYYLVGLYIYNVLVGR